MKHTLICVFFLQFVRFIHVFHCYTTDTKFTAANQNATLGAKITQQQPVAMASLLHFGSTTESVQTA